MIAQIDFYRMKCSDILFHCFLLLFGIAPLILGADPARAQSSSQFVEVRLPRGIALDLPKGWRLLGTDEQRLIAAALEAATDLSALEVPAGQETNLVAANSMPPTTYASVRVDSSAPPSVAPEAFTALNPNGLNKLERQLSNQARRLAEETLPLQGNSLIEFLGVRIGTVSGYPAIVTEYRRTGPKGPVFVQINDVFTGTQDVGISIAYREAEAAVWKLVLDRVRRSIKIYQ